MNILVIAGALALLVGCATPVTQRATISDQETKAEAARQRDMAVRDMVEEQRRLARVYRELGTKAVSLCGQHVGPSTGAHFMTNPKGDFSDTFRTAYGIGDKPSVLFVLTGSPAEVGGLRARDIVQTINGKSIPDADSLIAVFDELPAEAAIVFGISRGGETVSVTIKPDRACNYRIRLDPQQIINAFADGRQILIARGMIAFVRSDDELAIVIAHEMAHNVMKHSDARKQNFGVGLLADIAVAVLSRGQVSGANFSQAAAMAYSQEFEMEADYVGLYIMAQAGLPIAEAPNFWRRMAVAHPANIRTNHSASHPSTAQRMLALAATVREIEAKVQAKAALVPNVKDGKFEPPKK